MLDGDHVSLLSQGGEHASWGQRSKHKHHFIKTTTPQPTFSLDNVVLIDKLTSLQKHALVGRWYFSDVSNPNMRDWVDKKWKSMLGYMPTVV